MSKKNFDKMMTYLDEQMKRLPNLASKYMGLTMPFPQSTTLRNRVMETIESLMQYDTDVCIAAHFNKDEAGEIEYKEIIFLGNDYPHLKKIIDFMKGQEINLSIKNTSILYREFTADLNVHLKGTHSTITSLNDLFARVEIHMDIMEVGMGYEYENKQGNTDIIHYCCYKDDDEGKELGYQLFIKSLDFYAKKLLADGFGLGYPAVDSKIKIMDASCTMCFYRDYYYIAGAHISLKRAMEQAHWQLCEPWMEISMTCKKLYFEGNALFRKVDSLHILEEKEDCRLSFKSRLSAVIDFLEEFHNNNKDISNFHMKMNSYVPIEENTRLTDKFKIIYDVHEWKDEMR
ncbi:elongation factor G [Paenibacillus tyrfis]|uniref:elongation factor G n=1 Tax=Paenibacillus tyrfis TaxID=1501230 RepID=UPI002165C7A4|nr:elongation factor G [Paenibacillus tyrfis]